MSLREELLAIDSEELAPALAGAIRVIGTEGVGPEVAVDQLLEDCPNLLTLIPTTQKLCEMFGWRKRETENFLGGMVTAFVILNHIATNQEASQAS